MKQQTQTLSEPARDAPMELTHATAYELLQHYQITLTDLVNQVYPHVQCEQRD
jgi:hypothetical protein